MRRILPFFLVFLFVGCAKTDGTGPALSLRERLLQSKGCRFEVVITADYGDRIYSFTMNCITDCDGNVSFTVSEPESIAGISGIIDSEGGKLTFDDKLLAFPLLADDQLTPVSAPWLMMRTIRSGYISAGGEDGDQYKIQMDDSYEEDPLRLEVWLNQDNTPVHCDFIWKNRRFLSAKINNFVFE